jgi:mRNA interferase MazF
MPGATCDAFDIVVVPFPFTDKAAVKRRPALVISSKAFNASHDHRVLAMITTARADDWHSDVRLAGWKAAGLAAPCFVRLKLFTLVKSLVVRKVGALTARDRAKVREALATALA